MNRYRSLRRAGVTLTELLVVLVIVSILSSIAVPVYINRTADARRATAETECRALAQAEDTCAINHGFYVPLQILDDIPKGIIASTSGGSGYSDPINFESIISLVDPGLPYTELGGVNQPGLSTSSSDPRVRHMIDHWAGPFITPQRVYRSSSVNGNNSTSDDPLRDYPLDPWQQPYRFYSPIGIIGSGGEGYTMSAIGSAAFSNGVITTSQNRYDRFAVVSFGPNGKPDYLTPNDKDDIVYLFGPVNKSETTF